MIFHALNREHMQEIIDLELKPVASGLLEKGISLEVSDEAKSWMVEKSFDPLFGARPLRRMIQDHVEDKLSDAILEGTFSPGDTAVIDLGDDELVVTSQSPMPVAPA